MDSQHTQSTIIVDSTTLRNAESDFLEDVSRLTEDHEALEEKALDLLEKDEFLADDWNRLHDIQSQYEKTVAVHAERNAKLREVEQKCQLKRDAAPSIDQNIQSIARQKQMPPREVFDMAIAVIYSAKGDLDYLREMSPELGRLFLDEERAALMQRARNAEGSLDAAKARAVLVKKNFEVNEARIKENYEELMKEFKKRGKVIEEQTAKSRDQERSATQQSTVIEEQSAKIDEQERLLTKQTTTIDAQVGNIKDLIDKGRRYKEFANRQANKIKDQAAKIETLSANSEDRAVTVIEQSNIINEQTAKIQKLTASGKEQEAVVAKQSVQIKEQESVASQQLNTIEKLIASGKEHESIAAQRLDTIDEKTARCKEQELIVSQHSEEILRQQTKIASLEKALNDQKVHAESQSNLIQHTTNERDETLASLKASNQKLEQELSRSNDFNARLLDVRSELQTSKTLSAENENINSENLQRARAESALYIKNFAAWLAARAPGHYPKSPCWTSIAHDLLSESLPSDLKVTGARPWCMLVRGASALTDKANHQSLSDIELVCRLAVFVHEGNVPASSILSVVAELAGRVQLWSDIFMMRIIVICLGKVTANPSLQMQFTFRMIGVAVAQLGLCAQHHLSEPFVRKTIQDFEVAFQTKEDILWHIHRCISSLGDLDIERLNSSCSPNFSGYSHAENVYITSSMSSNLLLVFDSNIKELKVIFKEDFSRKAGRLLADASYIHKNMIDSWTILTTSREASRWWMKYVTPSIPLTQAEIDLQTRLRNGEDIFDGMLD